MKKLNWNPKVLYHGMCSSILDALSVISIVARDQIQKGSITSPTLTPSGSENSDGVPSTDSDLDHAIILYTDGDVYTKVSICCHQCGQEMVVGSINERAEVAVILSVRACGNCDTKAYHEGYQSGTNDSTKGF